MRVKSIAAALLAASLAACSSSTGSSSPQTPLTASAAFGVVNVDGKQKLYLPLYSLGSNGHAQIAVVDIGLTGKGTAGAKALLTTIDLGTANQASTIGATENLVVAAAKDNTIVWFIDPHTDAVVGASSLPAGSVMSEFSGGGGYVTGIVIDAATNSAIFAVGDGFRLMDLTSRTFGAHLSTPPAENFGFDPVARRIVAPFYDCPAALALCGDYKTPSGAVQSDGLLVIDLQDSTVYQYRLGAAPPAGPTPDEPVGGEPDTAAVDPSIGVAVVPAETDGSLNVLDLARATFDRATRTFTAPHQVIPSSGFEGAAAEPSAHFAFFENRFSPAVAVAHLSDAGAGGSGFLTGTMPDLPDGTSWSNAGDPHAIAATTSFTTGRSVGILVNFGTTWVARVDLSTMASTSPAVPGSLSAVELAPAVTYLDLSP